eukprot:TRINITY_DN19924_c0_g1_i1.p1 TRINITY_DN19924_c0_g1~~TRINITY_DN19924_c0_g1_i1.p1  ORF type:complete len:275 (+),score=59.94 TRINITY_DN19924_c0_g1_i1:74-898(+)
MKMRRFIVLAATAVLADASNRTITITGATGQSGAYTYKLLKEQGFNVRGLVRDTEKARKVLGCSKCDETEGIFVGDIRDPKTLVPAMTGSDNLIITTGTSTGEHAKDILFDGIENQVKAFLNSPGPDPKDRHVGLISMMETTMLDTFWNKILAKLWGGWQVGFYSLNGESFLMGANVPFTIIKCCGLDNTPPKQKLLLTGHDDKSWSFKEARSVSRQDVARILAAAAAKPHMAEGLRFDFCSKEGAPQLDEMDVLKGAMYSWDRRLKEHSSYIV